MLEKQLHEELKRFRSINKYADKLIMEQDAPLPDTGTPEAPVDPTAPTDMPPPPPGDMPPPSPDAAPPMGAPVESETEELDITDLVNMTKSIKNDLEGNRTSNGEVLNKMDDVFTKLNDLEQKIEQMDTVMAKIDQLDIKVGSMKEKTPEEKLEMRSLDSYPFNQNPQEFFSNKQDQMRSAGKNEYVLTKSDVQNYSNDTMKQSFNPQAQRDEYSF
jgi:hypothetical protein